MLCYVHVALLEHTTLLAVSTLGRLGRAKIAEHDVYWQQLIPDEHIFGRKIVERV
jgi:hypothetical protein